MEFTFHNSYVILKLVPTTVISWTQKLLKQGYIAPRLKSSLQKFYDRHHNLVDHYEISISQMTMELLLFEAGTTYPTRAPEFTPYFWLGQCCSFPCYDVHYDFRIIMMFGSSLPPVVFRRDHVLFKK
jgi:hypothetical protein